MNEKEHTWADHAEVTWNALTECAREQLLDILKGDDAAPFEKAASDEEQWIDSAFDAIASRAAYRAAIWAIQCERYERVQSEDVFGIITQAVEMAEENYPYYNPLDEYDHNDLRECVIHAAQCAAFMATRRARAAYLAAHPEDDDDAQLQLALGEDGEGEED